ncbi:MAG: InlB B-repeat-containing protein [Clostridia bacterium]|nr:InlB B-repeat-containing protein [Clostridia bacterium]
MRNNLVKISLLLIALLMVFCFAACGDDNTPPAEKIAIDFDAGRGEFADDSFIGRLRIEKGTAISDYPVAIREGYEFTGWYFDEDLEEKCESSHVFNEETTLYAGWVEVVYHTVKFDTSNATDGVKVDTQNVKTGGKVTAPDYTPARKGMVFFAWCVGGDKSKVWDFDNDVVTGDITLKAMFNVAGSGGPDEECVHDYQIESYTAPTCQTGGKRTERCTLCKNVQRYDARSDSALAKLPHLELEDRKEPTCALDGYSFIYCPNGCGLAKNTVLRALGNHEYDDMKWYTAIQPTKYVEGILENVCVKCGGAVVTQKAPLNATDDDLFNENVNVSYLYTGGSYVNAEFVNIASLGRVLASSYFNGTKAFYVNDENPNTFWNADTYVDGAKYSDDWVEIEFAQNYDIGVFKFIMPNYTAWELGDDCHVSYDVEYWDESTQSWICVGKISDKDAVSIGIKCQMTLELAEPINSNKIRARVTHASRYAPAVIYELEVYAKTEKVQRLPLVVSSQATATVSGKYNDWASGGGALLDNSTASYWYTDGRINANPWAVYEFPSEMYIACVQIAMSNNENREFTLEAYSNGEWTTVGKYRVPGKDAEGNLIIGGNVISNRDGICVFNIDIEKFVSKIRFTITKEPIYWESYIYDITPYSVVERPYNEPQIIGCTHENQLEGDVVPPTCDTPGYTVMSCNCGAQIRSKSTDVLGHSFGKYDVATPATLTSIGTKSATCLNGCGAVSTITYEDKYDAPVVTPYLHNAPAAWAQTFDDGNYLDTYEWVIPQLQKYGYRATTVMSITYTDSLVSTWNKHFATGVFDLGSHSYNHTSIYAGKAGATSLLAEVINAQYWFRHNYKGQYLLGFAAPLGATSTSVAEYLTGPLAANRNGGGNNKFYNLIGELNKRRVWGNLESYISKSSETEGIYVFIKKSGGAFVVAATDEEGNVTYVWDDKAQGENLVYQNVRGEYISIAKEDLVNYVFDYEQMTFVAGDAKGDGSYKYVASDWRYDYCESGSYNYVDGNYEFVEDNSGEYRLIKATVGSYEKGVELLVSKGGFTVECIHSLGSGSIYSSYDSTISKFEHLKRFGVWAGSYNDVIRYLKEAFSAKIDTIERTENSITISVTDNLDDYMFNHAITVKVDIPDSWTSVSVTQADKEIPFVAMSEYSQSGKMSIVSCAIEDGFLYVDVIPDGGNVVTTVGEKDASVNDYKDRVTVSFDPGEGSLKSEEYEAKVVIGQSLASMPTPVREGYTFKGWYKDEACTTRASILAKINADITLYAGWVELPTCKDGTYNHKWGSWLEDSNGLFHSCERCPAVEYDYSEKIEGEGTDNDDGKPVDPTTCTHAGTGACSLCGADFNQLMVDWIKENGVYIEANNSYSVINEIENDGSVQYIETFYNATDKKVGIVYKPSASEEITLDLGDIANGNFAWSYFDGSYTMSGTAKAGDITAEITELDYDEFDGLDEEADAVNANAATSVKNAIYMADLLLTLNNAATFTMSNIGFNSLS